MAIEEDKPALSRRWMTPAGHGVRLTALGLYPVLATIGAHIPERLGNEAVTRVWLMVRAAGGWPVSDDQLGQSIELSRARWSPAVDAIRTLQEIKNRRNFRVCACQTWTWYDAAHCRRCGHRFTSTEDMERDEVRRQAGAEADKIEARLAELSLGEGFLPIRQPSTMGFQWPHESATRVM